MLTRHEYGRPCRRPAFDLLPAIDLRGGRVVRLRQGDFARETAYGDDPAAVAERFADAGARWLHVVDLDGARDGERRQTDAVARIVAAVGGAVRVRGRGRPARRGGRGAVPGRRGGTGGRGHCRAAGPGPGRAAWWRASGRTGSRSRSTCGTGWRSATAGCPGAGGAAAGDAMATLADRGARTFEVTAIDRDGLLGGPDLDLLGRMVALGGGATSSRRPASRRSRISRRRAAIGCAGAIVGGRSTKAAWILPRRRRGSGSRPAQPRLETRRPPALRTSVEL